MGLISWIQCKYYDHRLNSGDKQLSNGNIDKAEDIYRDILVKQEMAVVHLSTLYVNNSDSKELKLQRLCDIEGLKEYVNMNNSSDYHKELERHVSNIYSFAQKLFSSRDYAGAVKLSEAIIHYRASSREYQDRLHRYKGFLKFSNSQATSNFKTELENCTKELDQIKVSKEVDIRNFQQQLISSKRYNRTIQLLLPFKNLNSDFKNAIIDCIIQIVSNNDGEYKNPKKITDFCQDTEITDLAARELAANARQFASKNRYQEAVAFDGFAAEFLSEDNSFNNERCCHILEECSVRANQSEISALLKFANSLKLTETQISSLKKRTLKIVETADTEKGLNICKLFIGETQFDKAYVRLASKLTKENNTNKLDTTELRKVIKNITTNEKLVDTLAIFVDYLPTFKKEIDEIATTLYDSGEKDKAYSVCEKVEPYQKSWLPLYITLRNKDLKEVSTITQTIKFYQDTTEKIVKTCRNCNSISDSHYSTLWDNYAQAIIKKSSSQPEDKAITSLSVFREQVYKYSAATSSYQDIVNSLTNQLVKTRWTYALEFEEDYQFDNAIAQYEAIKKENVSSYFTRATLRSLISSVKSGTLNKDIEDLIIPILDTHSFEPLHEDLAYRYSIYLLKHTRPSEAEAILKKYLPDEFNLFSICNNIFIKKAEDRLKEFNEKLQSMEEGTLSAEEAIKLHSSFEKTTGLISARLVDTKAKFPSYKNLIESYILRRLFDEELYSEAFDKVKTLYPTFIENDNAFKNMAIASLGLLENGERDDAKIKLAISIWISAVYADKLFVKCLDYTSWDDQYTFTLQNSFGDSKDLDYDDLPDNINFDDPLDNQNVSIKDVQNSLIIRIESIIRDKFDDYEAFYNAEKDAIDNLIKLNLDKDFILATPYLAKTSRNVFNSISHALDYDYEQNYDNNEDVLSTGVTYGVSGEAYLDYKATKQMADNCCVAVSGSSQLINSAFAQISRIKDFGKLYAIVKATVSTAMNEAIKNKVNYTSFLNQYEIVCKAMKETALSMACANYVNAEVIHRLNDKTMKESDGVAYLVRIYNLAPSNIQIKQILETVLCSLASECEEHNISSDVSALNKALRDTNGTFNAKVEDARIQGKLSSIIDQVNNNKMKSDAALKAVHELYMRSPDNARICENIVTICSICIHQYIIGDENSSTVKSILNSIKANKSATFRRFSEKLAKEYRDIWNQLPPTTQILLSNNNNSFPGLTLNSKGLELKAGLDYLKDLGEFSSVNSSFGNRLPGRSILETLGDDINDRLNFLKK